MEISVARALLWTLLSTATTMLQGHSHCGFAGSRSERSTGRRTPERRGWKARARAKVRAAPRPGYLARADARGRRQIGAGGGVSGKNRGPLSPCRLHEPGKPAGG